MQLQGAAATEHNSSCMSNVTDTIMASGICGREQLMSLKENKPAQFVLTEIGKLPFMQLTAEQKETRIYMNNNPNVGVTLWGLQALKAFYSVTVVSWSKHWHPVSDNSEVTLIRKHHRKVEFIKVLHLLSLRVFCFLISPLATSQTWFSAVTHNFYLTG